MKQIKKIFSFTIIILLFISTVVYGETSSYYTQDSIYKITETITLNNSGSSSYDFVYNIGSNSLSKYQQEVDLKISGNNAKLVTENGIKKITANGKFNKETKYTIVRIVKTQNIKYNVDLSNTSGNYSNFKDFSKYTKSDIKIESDSKLIKSISNSIFKDITNPNEKAIVSYGLVNTYLKYDTGYGNKGAYSALTNRKGVCEDYAELFVALLRSSGVPSRIVGGYWLDKDNNGNVVDWVQHAWAEYYLPEYGWIPVEPTNIFYVDGVKKIDWNYFAQLPKNDHIITGYNVNNSIDGSATVQYSGSTVTIKHQTNIQKIK